MQPIALRREEISERDAEALFEAAKHPSETVLRIKREPRRVPLREPLKAPLGYSYAAHGSHAL
jgi:hypothetical protein